MSTLPSTTGDASSQRASDVSDTYIQPALGHGLSIWWALYWRTSLIAIALVYFAALWIEILIRNDVLAPQAGLILMRVNPYLFTIAAAFFIMHHVVRKRYKGFRISLTPAGTSDLAHELPATRARSTRIWWSYTWRSVIYVVIASFIANIPMSFVLMAAAAVSPMFARLAGLLVGLVLNGAVGLFVIYSNILDEDIGAFRVGLAPAESRQAVAPDTPRAS